MLVPLTERQETILGMVVRSYIETGHPVGSKALVEQFDLSFSSATVRNELSLLGEIGYLQQQHTSAGRVPTELGYRYFVQKLLGKFHLPIFEKQMIRHQFHQARLDLSQWMRLAAAILARTSHGASFVTAPRARANRYKHLQLIATQGRLVLMVLVLHSGEVKQQMLTLAEPLPQVQLSHAAENLNDLYENTTYDEISSRMANLDPLEYEVTRLVLEILRRSENRNLTDIYRDGLVNLLDNEGTRQAVRVLEERALLSNVISQAMVPQSSGVHVVIGGDGQWEELKDCSIILSHYGVPDDFSGTVAVIGPIRMAYSRNVAAVQYIADLMSGFVYEYYADPIQQESIISEEESNT